MRVFLVGSDIPFRRHGQPGVTAVHIVLSELLRAMHRSGHEMVFQAVFNLHRLTSSLTPAEQEELHHLEALGIEVLPPLHSADYRGAPGARAGLRKAFRLLRWPWGLARIEDFYPATAARAILQERVRKSLADVILAVWSPEGLAATQGLQGLPRISYQGDVDFRPAEARFRDRGLFGPGDETRPLGRLPVNLERLRQRLWLSGFKGAHWRLMRDVDVIANVTASNADYYRRRGHTRSIYLRNTWSDQGSGGVGLGNSRPGRATQARPAKIIGHVGYLARTGSTYGLSFLLRDLAPRLAEAMRGVDYEVHIIGGGEMVPALRSWLGQPHFLMRGFVENLDAELRSSDVFLLLNNAGSYHAAYSRHLVAWSLGLCLIVHANSRLAIPEISHRENALVGSTPEEIAEQVRVAVTDPDLNRRLRQGGRATYERYFTPAAVAEALTQEMARVACLPTS